MPTRCRPLAGTSSGRWTTSCLRSLHRCCARRCECSFDLHEAHAALARSNRELESRVKERTAELEQLSRLKDEFLATMSHELRTPLNAIFGWVTLLRTRRLDEATQERALETIERNARAQKRLIEDLLDVSRIVTGKSLWSS